MDYSACSSACSSCAAHARYASPCRILESNGDDARAFVLLQLQRSIRQLADLTRLVRGELSSLHRKILGALITVDVHARDIVADLLKRGTKDVNEFEWQMQLRYYMEGEDVVVRQVGGRAQGGRV